MPFFQQCAVILDDEQMRDAARITCGKLEEKAEAFFCKNPQLRERKVSFRGLSLEDM